VVSKGLKESIMSRNVCEILSPKCLQ